MLKGKSGSGKSTLLKYALKKTPALNGEDVVALSFFFHSRGHELQRTPLGLYRCLLYQLLKHVPGALTDLIDKFDEQQKTVGFPGEIWHWHQKQLRVFFESWLPRILKRFPVTLFIDALDQCGEHNAVMLIRYFKNLLKILPPDMSHFGFSLHVVIIPYWSSITDRPYGLKINKDDIAVYVQHRLSDLQINRKTPLSVILTTHASGVFIWAHLQRCRQVKKFLT